MVLHHFTTKSVERRGGWRATENEREIKEIESARSRPLRTETSGDAEESGARTHACVRSCKDNTWTITSHRWQGVQPQMCEAYRVWRQVCMLRL